MKIYIVRNTPLAAALFNGSICVADWYWDPSLLSAIDIKNLKNPKDPMDISFYPTRSWVKKEFIKEVKDLNEFTQWFIEKYFEYLL